MSPKIIRGFFLVIVTMFLLIDYFPNIPVLNNIPGIVFFILLIIYLILGSTIKKAKIDQHALKTQGYVIGYVVVVGVLFMLFGEGSQGITIFLHGVFVFSLFIALFELLRDYSYFKQNQKREQFEQKNKR